MKNILEMNFADNNYPDFGSIKMNKKNGYLHLLSADIGKLNDLLTRAVCVGTYGVGEFSFDSGDIAVVDDASMSYVYNATADHWYLQVSNSSYTPPDTAAGWIEMRLYKNGVVYVLEDDEKIIFNVIKKSDDTILLTKTLFKWHYLGGGLYMHDLNRQDIDTVHSERDNFKFSIGVAKNETDITGEFTVKDCCIMDMIYDGGDENAE